MEQLSDIKKRIKSVTDIKQMTRAMQLISAVKMRRARNQLEKTMPFFALCAESMIEIRDAGLVIDNPFFQLREKKRGETWKIGYFIMTGEQGLAGAYNLNVLATIENHVRNKMIDNTRKGLMTTAQLYLAGSIGKDRLIRDGFNVVENFRYPISEPTYHRARDISDYIYDLYETGALDLVYVIYTKIESAISMKPMVTRILPVNPNALEQIVPEKYSHQRSVISGGIVEYSPSVNEVMSYLINTYLNGMVYGVLTEAYASEQTARMTAMDNATDNATEMMQKLTLLNNQARQARITNELTEIVGGAEVLAKLRTGKKVEGEETKWQQDM
ncbi:MAG: ATP synthase F1 subunit gamma [Clostridiaceae bacterium]|nr:ATP synthase F1 subunit gamma [Clostridiaceae bacterium]